MRCKPHLLFLCLFLSSGGVLEGVVRTGIDRLFEEPYFAWIQGKRIGLITNHSGVNSQLITTRDILARQQTVELHALFGPEHGIGGQEAAGRTVLTIGNVYSLYGENKAPTQEMLEGIDVLIYDMQDVGVRFYTYISTLFLSMEAAAKKGIPFVVLDRPNPVGGIRVEGPVLEPGRESFVGIWKLPIRYGMTPGELARLFNREAELNCELRVVPLEGWNRPHWYDETGLQWISPSPNMATLTTAAVYPGLCLVEGTNLSEGRGTAHPFELIGAPWLDSTAVAERLNRLKLPGVHFRPQAFTPSSSKFEGQVCRGIQVHVLDRKRFEPIPAALHLLAEVHRRHPARLQFSDTFFDRLVGNSWIRQGLIEGTPVEEITNRWQPRLRQFKETRQKYLIYD